jgi:hypothetical protein
MESSLKGYLMLYFKTSFILQKGFVTEPGETNLNKPCCDNGSLVLGGREPRAARNDNLK